MFKAVIPLLLLATPACVSAQSPNRSIVALAGEVTATQVMQAEHQQWIADHQRWRAEHADLARRLDAASSMLRSEDNEFARDARELTAHGDALRTASDPQRVAALVANHVRVASEHARAAQAHHELVDEVARLEALLKDDEATQMDDREQ